ncbi:MAG: branched-chain amino acid transaminase [Nitrososphaerota archaeon]|nr:branched-chain amino acid transaminase [Nitrososphaerota archaeon]
MNKTDKIWMDGRLVPWENATVHVMTHSLHYGSAIFEGARCYNTVSGSRIFRLNEHVGRFYNSAKIYGMVIPYAPDEIADAIKMTIKENHVSECYIRPIAFYGWDEAGINPKDNKVHVAIAVWPWAAYMGEEGLKNGVTTQVSTWARIDNRSMPSRAKIAANYANSILAKTEAQRLGFSEAILLNVDGMVTEGSGENIFMVSDGKITTPPISAGALPGITRDSIIEITRKLGYEVEESNFTRSDLVLADEAFFTGTAAEVTPIREIDGRKIGNGVRGPTTEKIQAKFFDVVKGRDASFSKWLVPL